MKYEFSLEKNNSIPIISLMDKYHMNLIKYFKEDWNIVNLLFINSGLWGKVFISNLIREYLNKIG